MRVMQEIGVETFALKKITKHLSLVLILVALKWDHLAALKLDDHDFRTLVCIDLLLGAEIFTSILHDGRQTGHRGTPFAINNCFGWVVFGKIQGSNVVDVVNLRELTDRSLLPVCSPIVLGLDLRTSRSHQLSQRAALGSG